MQGQREVQAMINLAAKKRPFFFFQTLFFYLKTATAGSIGNENEI